MTIKVTYNITDVYMTQSVSPVYINVSYSGGGSSGGGVWGTITGTLSNQTDLQNALNAKFDDPTGTTAQYLRGDGSLATFPSLTGYVPYSGATTNVDLGEYELKAGQLTLDVSPTGTAAVGTTRWNDTTGVSETTLKGGNVLLRNGVDLVARVVNKVTPNTTLTKAAYQAVRVSGAQGQRLAVAFAQANNDANSADTIGLVIETIPTNQEGFIMAVGQLENINTTGSLQGETWVDGDVLYLSPTTAGSITKVKPTGNGHIVVIGYVEYAHANNGKIYVKVMNGWELTELHDTEIVSPANNEALIYESSSALWKNKSIATALGYTPANAATTLTINGVTYDLSTSRTWTISAGISGSGTNNYITKFTSINSIGNSILQENANFIGLNVTPKTWANYQGLQFGQIGAIASNDFGGNNLQTLISNNIFFDGSNFKYIQNGFAQMIRFQGNGSIQFSISSTGLSNGNITLSTPMQINSIGNILINATTDNGQRLQVYGDTLLRGSGATLATSGLLVQNSSSNMCFQVFNDQNVAIASGAYFGASNIIRVGASSSAAANLRFTTSLNYLGFYGNEITTALFLVNPSSSNNTSGTNLTVWGFAHAFNPTSGTASYVTLGIAPTINQTGGANGITRGLYVNPTLTAAADFRAIETARGNIVFSNLPTSSAGLPSGALWNNGGVINIV